MQTNSQLDQKEINQSIFLTIPSESSDGKVSQTNTSFNLTELLKQQLQVNASDLHISTGDCPYYRNRDGRILFLTDYQLVRNEDIDTIARNVLGDNYPEFIIRKQFDYAVNIDQVGRFRVNFYYDRKGLGAVFRKLPNCPPSISDVDVPESIVKLSETSNGLILICGQNNSGKSTTIAALVDHINQTRASHSLIVEDPIEIIHENKTSAITQREVGKHTHSYAEAIKSALRQDVDIVVVGEMRDIETIQTAVNLAEAGYLVLGTLHTRSALESVQRIVNAYPPESQALISTQLSMLLKAVMCQKLLPRIDQPGLVMCREIIIPDYGIRNLLRQGKSEQLYGAMETNRIPGNILFDRYLLALYEKGIISKQTVEEEAQSTDTLKKIITK